MGRRKENQKLFDELGEEGYNELKRNNKKKQDKVYRDANREEINAKNNVYYNTHKKEIAEQHKEYNKTPAGRKTEILCGWRKRGITFGDMTDSEYYDKIYLPATQCQSCNKTFDKINRNNQKQADHKHDPLNPCNIRGVICFACNIMDNWKKRLTPNSIYQQYLTKPPLTDTLINTNKNSINKG